MILRFPLINLFSRTRPDGRESLVNKESTPSTASCRGYRLVKIALAIYLIPALLVVLLVGAIGALVVGFVRFLCLVGSRSDPPGNSPDI